MRRTRAQGLEVRGRIGKKIEGGVKKRKTHQTCYRRDVKNGGNLGGTRKKT